MIKKDWREFDTEGILKGMLYGMTTNELMTDNRFRHCKSVRDYSIEIIERIYKLVFPLSNGKLLEDNIILFSHAALMHDCMKGAANADTGVDHGKLAANVFKSIFGSTALPVDKNSYDLIIEAIAMHSNKTECLGNTSNPYLIALIFGDMIDHITPEYEAMMRKYAEEMKINVDVYIGKKKVKIKEAIDVVEKNPHFGFIKDIIIDIIKRHMGGALFL